MCNQGDTVRLFLSGGWRDVDMCISNIVAALNDGGATTVASCCGHGQRTGNIALADGRELIIAESDSRAPTSDLSSRLAEAVARVEQMLTHGAKLRGYVLPDGYAIERARNVVAGLIDLFDPEAFR